MATTTNYGWSTPDDTSLVKDGAAAIRTLGSSVDTTTKNLNPQTTTGAIAYRSSTSNVNTSLPIGTAGQVLAVNSGATAPEWVTALGGMTLISTLSASNSATVEFTSIPATYRNILVYVRNFKPANDAATLYVRYNSDATANRHSDQAISGTASTAQTFDTTFAQIANGNDNSVANGFVQFQIFDYANTSTWKFGLSNGITTDETTTTSYKYRNRFSVYNQTGAISSLQFLANTGNITSGDFLLYGVK